MWGLNNGADCCCAPPQRPSSRLARGTLSSRTDPPLSAFRRLRGGEFNRTGDHTVHELMDLRHARSLVHCEANFRTENNKTDAGEFTTAIFAVHG